MLTGVFFYTFFSVLFPKIAHLGNNYTGVFIFPQGENMSNSYYFKPVDQLTFADNWMFQAVLRYTFRTRCDENPETSLNDKCLKVIYNASAYKQEKDPLVRSILHFINTNDPGEDTFANRLSSLVETLKERDIFRQEYSAVNLHDRDLIRMAKRDGIEEGKAQAKLENAITAVKKYKASLEDVSKDFGVPLETLQEALKEA